MRGFRALPCLVLHGTCAEATDTFQHLYLGVGALGLSLIFHPNLHLGHRGEGEPPAGASISMEAVNLRNGFLPSDIGWAFALYLAPRHFTSCAAAVPAQDAVRPSVVLSRGPLVCNYLHAFAKESVAVLCQLFMFMKEGRAQEHPG